MDNFFVNILKRNKCAKSPLFIVHFQFFYDTLYSLIMRCFMKNGFYDLYVEEVEKNDKLSSDFKYLKNENLSLNNRIKYLENTMQSSIQNAVDSAVSQVSAVYEDKIDKLIHKISHLESVLYIDSNNSGTSTSMTAINKQKRIPNTCQVTDRHIGGQTGHTKHKLEKFKDEDITDQLAHETDKCDYCGGALTKKRNYTSKDEFDFEVKVKKIRHNFYSYVCESCCRTVKVSVPSQLKEENQYGMNVQALAITLMNQGYVSMSRTREIISGLTQNEMSLSEGYIAKLQKRMANQLEGFIKELKKEMLSLSVVHWDDTVIMINKKRACLRFYGNEKTALYTAHEKKDKEGLDQDGILTLLGKETVVVHDHNIVNYNDEYEFQNAECCVHLIRDLQKVIDNLHHEWAENMIRLIVDSYKKRESILGLDVRQVELDYDMELSHGEVENLNDKNAYYADKEKALLKRLEEYKENYLMWAVNEEIPFTNNESERSLRSSKTKMKVSGQFQNIKSAENFADIKSYIETGKRYGMNPIKIIKRALAGDYCTLDEMKGHEI